jgi:hypothetical protein
MSRPPMRMLPDLVPLPARRLMSVRASTDFYQAMDEFTIELISDE